jgi:predicted ATP-dependent endonuclease of OLD family
MKLKSFRVMDFRSVKDSGWIDSEQITALIGTNESGKTNILLPLWKLNPADEGIIDLKDDLPRDMYHIYREANPKPVFIQAKYVLTEEEKEDLVDIAGHEPEEFSEIIVSKDYDDNYFWDFPYEREFETSNIDKAKNLILSCKEKLDNIKDFENKAESARFNKAFDILCKAENVFNDQNNTIETLKKSSDILQQFTDDIKTSMVCAAMSELLQKVSDLIGDADKTALKDVESVITYIKDNMPKYVYYSNY